MAVNGLPAIELGLLVVAQVADDRGKRHRDVVRRRGRRSRVDAETLEVKQEQSGVNNQCVTKSETF